MTFKNYINISLIILVIFLIFSFSSQDGDESGSLSDALLIKIYQVFHHEELTEDEEELIIEENTHLIRKSTHFTIYLILGLLVFNLYKDLWGITPTSVIFAIILCFVYSITDEIHQLFVAGRSGEILDILIDTAGASIGILIYYFISRKKLTKNS